MFHGVEWLDTESMIELILLLHNADPFMFVVVLRYCAVMQRLMFSSSDNLAKLDD